MSLYGSHDRTDSLIDDVLIPRVLSVESNQSSFQSLINFGECAFKLTGSYDINGNIVFYRIMTALTADDQ